MCTIMPYDAHSPLLHDILMDMQDSRQLAINTTLFHGKSVLYVMSRDQRTQDNHALLAAQELAVKHNVAVYVLFVFKKAGVRSREHYQFMLDGLREVERSLELHNIPFIMRYDESPYHEILTVVDEIDVGAVFFDFSPLKGARKLVKKVAANCERTVTVVDTHNIIPAWVVSDKQEYAAHTMRSKVHKKLEHYLLSPPPLRTQTKPDYSTPSLTFEDAQTFVDTIPTAGIHISAKSGEHAAHDALTSFIDSLENYAVGRNDIAHDQQSGLSPYLHYGQISSLRVALDVTNAVDEPPLLLTQAKLAQHGEKPSRADGMNALLEEMIIRKELSDNFCLYAQQYKSAESVAAWAKKTVNEHSSDTRDFIYSQDEWEAATTHDEVWNAAQNELNKTGKMHGYMRMYWAKKILEWSATPESALRTAIYLNDKYSIDGGDPNGYVGILWSIYGLHDRPWFERSVYGKVRYMNSSGLRKKYNVDAYIQHINSL